MSRKIFVGVLTLVVFMPVIAIGTVALMNGFEVKELKVFGEVPSFSLTERTGQLLRKEDLQGKVWLASFIYTHCAGQCPMISKQMKEIQRKLRFKERFRLVSISVDPERDTPSELTKYADEFEADPYKWLFLTGNKNEIIRLMRHGFRLASADDKGVASGEILHSDKLVLVDHMGKIRGYYDAFDEEAVKTMMKDTKSLIRKAF